MNEQTYFTFLQNLYGAESGTVLATSKDGKRNLVAHGDDRGAYIDHLEGENKGAHDELSDIQVSKIIDENLNPR